VTLTFRRYNSEEARGARDIVEAVYRGAYWENIESGDPFSQPQAFMGRYDSYASNPLFDLVIAFEDDKPVGQAWGWALSPNSRWWEALESEPEPGFTVEDGTRTFALSEIMVARDWTGRGVARALHDGLLRGRQEQRATLLVRPANTRAYSTYLRWGWRTVAKSRPHWPDAPTFDVLILPLPLKSVET
jgi:ribosomal protein S18 acetylase RimI-like enzyme